MKRQKIYVFTEDEAIYIKSALNIYLDFLVGSDTVKAQYKKILEKLEDKKCVVKV